jgi:hypothetical protein
VTASGEQSGRAVRVIPAAAVGADLTHPPTVHPHCNLQHQWFYVNISSGFLNEKRNEKQSKLFTLFSRHTPSPFSGRAELTHFARWMGYLFAVFSFPDRKNGAEETYLYRQKNWSEDKTTRGFPPEKISRIFWRE